MDKLTALKQYFGYDSLRGGQEPLMDALLAGRDVLGVMPTGAGKSLCYQLPALLLPGLTLVISPLISLMKDQVAALNSAGIPSAFLRSSLPPEEYFRALRAAEQGHCKLLYVTPERLMSEHFLAFARRAPLSLLAIDEAHCVSQWGQDFRPSYLGIADFLTSLPQRPVVGAFTATATDQVKSDIEKLLGLKSPLRVTTGFDRPNLYFEVRQTTEKRSHLLSFLAKHRNESGIIYCATRKKVDGLCEYLNDHNIPATRYHAGLEDEERRQNQDAFVCDTVQVMVATNAFGMGIDKSNVRFVVHYNMPQNLESYYQEAGRAGRDGSDADCLLLFSEGDIHTARFLLENGAMENEVLTEEERKAVHEQDLRRLRRMISYCKSDTCLRHTMLSYFGEHRSGNCGNCGVCLSGMVRRDMTVEAQKILSAVVRAQRTLDRPPEKNHLISMLHGDTSPVLAELGLDRLSTYAIMSDTSPVLLGKYIDYLRENGYLEETSGGLSITSKARPVLFQGEKMRYVAPETPETRLTTDGQIQADNGLFQALKELRATLARRESVPAYVVFSDTTLLDMAAKHPQDEAAFLRVHGVGTQKAKRYAKPFLSTIQNWLAEH